MNKLIVKVISISLVAIALLTSCQTDPSLQQYYVDSSEKDGFVTTSIPKTIVGIDASTMSEDSRLAYESIDKINVVALPYRDGNESQLEQETTALESIFKNEKYELLMSHNSNGMKMKLMYDGTQDAIDEIIVYGSAPKMGLGVARVMGDDMNVNAIMAMLQEMDTNNMDATAIVSMMEGLGMGTKKDAPATE